MCLILFVFENIIRATIDYYIGGECMEYESIREIADEWGISKRRIQVASAVILGHTFNGNVDWKTENGTKLKD